MADPIPVAMIGTGHAHATGKLRVLQRSPDYQFVGVCEPDDALRKKRQASSAFRKVTWLGLDQVLGNEAIKLIAIETHVRDNLRYALMAIEAGKHIHLDKPPGDDLPALKNLFERAARKHLYIQMGYMWRYNQGFKFALEAAAKGWLGQVYLVRAMINSVILPSHRRELARFPGGMMFELGCHMLDRIIAVLGSPTKVTPFLRHDHSDDDTLADNTLAVFEFDRATAVLGSAARQPDAHRLRSFEVIGTGGTVQIQPIEPPAVHLHLAKPHGDFKVGHHHVPVKDRPRYVGDFEEFARIIRDQATPSFTPEHDLRVQRALLQACGQKLGQKQKR